MAEVSETSTQASAINKIPILEADNWTIFYRRAKEFLILSGYDNLLEDDEGEP